LVKNSPIKGPLRTQPESKVEINGAVYHIDSLISEGGFGFVYRVHTTDIDPQAVNFAMKKMILQDPVRLEKAQEEVRIWRSLKGHPSIVEFIDYKLDMQP
jgi:serine/threonine protein kinase